MIKKSGYRNDGRWVLSVLCVAFLSSLYFVSSAGIVSTNDGAHFALTRALVNEHSLTIDPDLHFTVKPDWFRVRNETDISYYDGRWYSDRPPGTAIAAVPFYTAAKAYAALTHRSDLFIGEMGVVILPSLAGALSVLLVYRIVRLLGESPWVAVATSITLAFGTLHWKYATTLYSHAFSTALILAAVYIALRIVLITCRSRAHYVALGAILGYAITVEYPNLLLGWIILGYLFAKSALPWRMVLPLLAAYIVFSSPFPIYNLFAFDDPLTIPYRHHAGFVEDRAFDTMMNSSLTESIPGLILGDSTPMGPYPRAWGLLQTSPVLVLVPLGMAITFWWRRSEATLFTTLFLAGLLVASRHYSWYGDHDTRYIMTVTPYVVLMLAGLLRALDRQHRLLWPGLALFGGLLLVSIWSARRMLLVFFNHFGETRLSEPLLRNLLASPAAWQEAFLPGLPYLDQIAAFWLFVGFIWISVVMIRDLLSRSRRSVIQSMLTSPDMLRVR
jgi:hypothetical protein